MKKIILLWSFCLMLFSLNAQELTHIAVFKDVPWYIVLGKFLIDALCILLIIVVLVALITIKKKSSQAFLVLVAFILLLAAVSICREKKEQQISTNNLINLNQGIYPFSR